jgi:hypothetical protein
LEHMSVRLVTDRGEQDRFDQLLVEHHYLHSATLVGEHLRYVVSYKGQWCPRRKPELTPGNATGDAGKSAS